MWFEFHDTVRNDPAVDNLRRSLRLAKAEAIGHLTLLYSWTVSGRCFDGDISSVTPEQIADASAFSEDKAVEWVKALIDTGFVSRDPSAPNLESGKALAGRAMLVNWTDFCGEPTRKKMERHTAATNGSHAAATDLETLLSVSINSNSSKAVAVNPVFSLFRVLKYVKKDKDMGAVKTDTRWDTLNKDRQLPWCKKILQSYDGDLKKAATAMLQIGEYFENIGCTWDASTVHKRLTDWEEGRLGQN